MRPARAIATGFTRSLQFSGRAKRPEFWWLVLFAYCLAWNTLVLNWLLSGYLVIAIFGFVIGFWPLPAAGNRRLRDAGSPLGWLFAGLLGLMWLTAVWCLAVTGRAAWFQSSGYGPEFGAGLVFMLLSPGTGLLLLAFILPLTRRSAAEQPLRSQPPEVRT